MTRILTTTAIAVALIAGCSPAADEAPDSVEDSAAPSAASESASASVSVSVCPDDMVLTLDDYATEELPEADEADLWHTMNAQRDSVEETDSGLQYKVIQSGLENGLSPEAGEEVFAMYHGYRTDGEVFDSSYVRNEPFIFRTNQVISGWTEAVESMKVCEARTLYIPSDIAYGDRGAGGVIRPGETLVFNMQLLRVNRETAQ